MVKLSTILIVFGLAAVLPTMAFAAIIRVPADQPTIQAAVDAAVSMEDTVLLADGIYTGEGNRDIQTWKGILIKSENGPAVTIIDCEGSAEDFHRVFYFANGGPTLMGITIRGGYAEDGGGIYCGSTILTLRNCILEDNYATLQGGALYFRGNDVFTVAATITDCTFSGNSADMTGGGAFFLDHAVATLNNCTFTDNSAQWGGGGVGAEHVTTVTLEHCLFTRNSARQGAGLHNFWVTSATVTNCTFSGNDAPWGGSSIFCQFFCSVQADNSILAFGAGGVAVDCPDTASSVNLSCSDVFGNTGGDWVGCIADQADANGNFSLDPLFCNRFTGNLYLRDDSPCLPANNSCGVLIGAFGLGCSFICGDIDGDGSGPNVADLTYLIDYLFADGPPPGATEAANVDGESGINVADVSYLMDYLFTGGPPLDCP